MTQADYRNASYKTIIIPNARCILTASIKAGEFKISNRIIKESGYEIAWLNH